MFSSLSSTIECSRSPELIWESPKKKICLVLLGWGWRGSGYATYGLKKLTRLTLLQSWPCGEWCRNHVKMMKKCTIECVRKKTGSQTRPESPKKNLSGPVWGGVGWRGSGYATYGLKKLTRLTLHACPAELRGNGEEIMLTH